MGTRSNDLRTRRTELLEREFALQAIASALGAVREGSGGVLFVAGPAGIGKTAVLGQGALGAQEAGYRIASAVGSPMESGLPFGLIGQAIVALGGSEVDDPAELQRLGGQPARLYRMFRWLTNVAAEVPLLLVLDDLHWADPDSLQLLGFLCRRLSGAPILVLGGLRPEPVLAWSLARELVGSGRAGMVSLVPLSEEASRALLERSVSDELDRDQRDGVVRACAGTPLLLKAAAASLSGGGSLPSALADGGFGSSLLLERFAGMGDEAFAYVRAAAILGVRFEPPLAGALAGLELPAWRLAHTRLVRAQLLDDLQAGGAAFVHPLFAQSLLDSQPVSARQEAHARAFRLLVDRGMADALAAEHAVAAGLHGDLSAIDVTARAGREALGQGALEAARAHLANAVELAGSAAQAELLLEYALALTALARTDEAQEVCARVLSQTGLDPAARARALGLLARGAIIGGQPAEGEALFEQAAAVAADGQEPGGEAMALIDAANSLDMLAPLPWTLGILGRALAVLPADDPSRGAVEFLDALTRLEAADPSGEELIARTVRGWQSHPGPTGSSWAWTMATNAINALKLFEALDSATELFEREFARAVDAGAPLAMIALAIVYADAVWRIGHARQAFELVKRATALSDQPIRLWSDAAFAITLTELGRDEEAAPYIESLRSLTAHIGAEHYAPQTLWLCVLDARRLLAAGEREQASQVMSHAGDVARLTGWRHPLIVPWAGVAVEAHLSAGRIDRATELIEELDELSRPLSCRWPRAIVVLGRAQLAGAHNEAELADRLFDQALGVFAEVPMPIFHAEALVTYGAYLRRSGRPQKAREPLARAVALGEQAEAERVARVARAELAACGGRRRRGADDPNELTAQEQRVAELAAGGLSNGQIAAALHLSPKTIGHYLERIYVKLDIHSRRELIAQGARRPNDRATAP